MGKVLSIIMALVVCLSLFACGGTDVSEISDSTTVETTYLEETQQTEVDVQPINTTWRADATVDEFGDVTEDSVKIIKSTFSGDFSNTTTYNAALDGVVFIVPDSDGAHFSVSFRLFEYGNSPATYLQSEAKNITLKIKMGDKIKEYSLFGVAPNGDLFLGLDKESDCDYFVDSLYLGKDMRCIITIGSSQYNFNISSEGFAEVFQQTYQIHSSMDALKVYLSEEYNRAGAMYLMYSSSDLAPVTTDELPEVIVGYWQTDDIESNALRSFYEYTEDGKKRLLGEFRSDGIKWENVKEEEYYIEDGLLHVGKSKFEFMEITDGYYLVYYYASWGPKYYYLYIKSQEDGTPLYQIMR